MNKQILGRTSFRFDDDCNGGEGLSLTTEFFRVDEEDEIQTSQELTLQSYGNSATFNLFGTTLTPQKLRQAALDMESQKQTCQQVFGLK